MPNWKVVVPSGACRRLLLPGDQQDAPHPDAARLWEEFLYSDEGQNLWLEGVRPTGAVHATW